MLVTAGSVSPSRREAAKAMSFKLRVAAASAPSGAFRRASDWRACWARSATSRAARSACREVLPSESTRGPSLASAGPRSRLASLSEWVMSVAFCRLAVSACTFCSLKRRRSCSVASSTLEMRRPPRCSMRSRKPGRSGIAAGLAALDASRLNELPSSRSSTLAMPVTPCTPSSAQVDSVMGVFGATPMRIRTWPGLSGFSASDCTLPTGTPW